MNVSKVKVKLRRRPDYGIEVTLRGVVKVGDKVDLNYDMMLDIITTLISEGLKIPTKKGSVNCEQLNRNNDPHSYMQMELIGDGAVKVKLHDVIYEGCPSYDEMLTILKATMLKKIGNLSEEMIIE